MLYNPLSFAVCSLVRLPVVVNSAYSVLDGDEQPVYSQLIPIADGILNIPGRMSEAKFELVFEAADLPPMGMKSYYAKMERQPANVRSMRRSKVHSFSLPRSQDIRVFSNDMGLKFDGITGQLVEITTSQGPRVVKQGLFYYEGMAGNNTEFEYRASGAYIFRPDSPAVPLAQVVQLVTVSGPLFTQVRQVFADGSCQIFSLNRGESTVQVDWIVGPIRVDDGVGKEFVVRFTPDDVRNSGVFYTDLNGREMLQRKINYRPTWRMNVTEPVAGNYYPVNSIAYIDDVRTDLRMVVLNDRAQGASSLQDGTLEFMVIQTIYITQYNYLF